MRWEGTIHGRTVGRLLVALLVLTAGIAVGTGAAVADHGDQEPEEVPTSGGEVCDEVFGGPHLGWWCHENVGDPIDETVHETTS